MSKKIRKGDQVIVITGNDRGKVGKVLSMNDEKLVIEGVNIRKKHMKRTQQNQKGQIIDIERPIHISNVKICVDEKPVKLRVRSNKQGERELYYLQENKAIVYRSLKKAKS